jgi:serine/threonine protein phosphatase PrpC
MLIGILAAVLMLIAFGLLFRGRSGAPSTVAVTRHRAAAPPKAVAVPRIGGTEDADEDITVAAKIGVPKLASAEGPESTRILAPIPLPEEHATDDEADDDLTGMRRMILVNAVARTDAGMLRKENEDCYLVLEDYGLFVVCDGMGGHAGGEIASSLAVETIGDSFEKQAFPGVRRVTRYRRANELVRALELANEQIRVTADANSELADMGTTCVAARFSPGKERVYIGSAGDSRIYRVRNGAIEQMTKDHTLAVEAGAKGALGAQLTRGLGIASTVRPDIRVEDALPGDSYVLCSDGLTKMLTDSDIRECVLNNDLALAAKALVASANDRGGRDNITVILVRVTPA